MKTEIVKLYKIKNNPNNPRLIKDDKFHKLVKSIKEFPEMLKLRPIVVNDDLVVLGGNMRKKACKEAGLKEVPIIKASELTVKKQREFIIKDNVGYGEWDWDLIANEWDAEQLDDWGLDLPVDFNVVEEEAEEDNYVEPDNLKVDVVIGDLIQIGNHRLLCGSSTQLNTWKKLMDGKLCDLVVTDPPYNVDYQGSNGLKIMNDKMQNKSFYKFLYDFYTSLSTYTKEGGAWYVWHADSEGVNFRTAFEDSGLLLKQCLVWVKNALVMGRQDYQWKHEPCLYGWKSGAAHYFTHERNKTTVIEDSIDVDKLKKEDLKKLLNEILSEKTPTSVLKFNKPTKNDVHPTMKPILLLAPLIQNSSKPDEIVADGFLGSGSTMVAAHQLKRKCYGMELDPKYCQVIIDRMQKLDDTLEIKINGKSYGK